MSKTAVSAPGQGRVPQRPSGRGRQGPRPPQTNRRPNAMSPRANISRRRRRLFVAFGSIAVVTGVAAALVVVALAGGSPSSDAAVSPPKGLQVPPALTVKLISVPLSTMDAAPTGGLNRPAAINDPPLRALGKPDLLYVGAEFCPVCAAERWPLYVALSKFGTFTPAPGEIHSGLTDGDIPTVTFYGTDYNSAYFTFTPEETTTNQRSGNYYVPLQQLTPAQQALWQSHTNQSFPWLDFGGKEQLATAQYNPGELEGRTFADIAAQVGNNTSTIGGNIDGSAAVLVRTICSALTNDQPAQVCQG